MRLTFRIGLAVLCGMLWVSGPALATDSPPDSSQENTSVKETASSSVPGRLTGLDVSPGRAVLHLTGPRPKLRQLKMTGPARLILDLQEVLPRGIASATGAGGGFERVRVGSVERKTRLVFDAPAGAPLPPYKVEQSADQVVVTWGTPATHATTEEAADTSTGGLMVQELFETTPASGPVPTSSSREEEGRGPTQAPILPETTTPVILSAKDVNRISCPGPIQDLLFSSEKGVEGKFNGNSAFLKFKIFKAGENRRYATDPVELFIVCDGDVYTLIATPREDVHAVTLRLQSSTRKELKSNQSLFEGLPMSKKIKKLITEAYRGTFPDSYTSNASDRLIEGVAGLFVREVRRVSVAGEGLEMLELQVRGDFTATAQGKVSVREVRETDFVSPTVGEGILAVAVLDHQLVPNQATRVFVVRHKGGEQ